MLNISVTERARRQLARQGVGDDTFLRVAVVAGGCNGNTYDASLDTQLKTEDEVIYQEGELRLVADPRSALFLDGLRIDYSDDLIQAGFRLTNANAGSACGCGASFSG